MIKLGLTTWSEHQTLLHIDKPTLAQYSTKLPLVEIDSSFYGIPRITTVENWVKETPENFKFVIKAHKAMTQHSHWQEEFLSEEEVYRRFLEAMTPLIQAKKIETFLFQFPPYFSCTKENIVYLRRIRKIFKGLPVAIEFRNSTWFDENRRNDLLLFMRSEEFILTIVDEPPIPLNSIPFFPEITNSKQTLIRLHGRNTQGWLKKDENWREERTLYRYNEAELTELSSSIKKLIPQVQDIAVVFNNNSGGDAADNVLRLKKILNLEYTDLHPEQMDLF